MKRKLLLAALCVVGALGMRAQTDVTASYIGDVAWIVNGGGHSHDSGNHKESDGIGWWNTQELSGWHAFAAPNANGGAGESWTSGFGKAGVMMGRTMVLPAGNYTLSFEAFACNAMNSADPSTMPSAGDGVAFLTGKNNVDITNTASAGDATFHSVSFTFDVTTANTAYEFGIKKLTDGSKIDWCQIKNVKLELNSTNIFPVPNNSIASFTYSGSQTWHTNTWSTEGQRDGSRFQVPFHELWVASGGKLDDATIKGTYTPTESGVYKVSAWVRAMNESGGAVTGAKIFVGDVDADACSGSVVYDGKGRLGTYTAMADGEAGTPFEYGFVLEDAEINWLAFKNVTITYLGTMPQEEIDALMAQVPTGKMNATVKSALDGLVSAFEDNASVANYNALSLYLPTAEASAAIYADINTAISSYATKAAALDAAGSAAYDASAIQTKYDNGTYETLAEAESELSAAYKAAVKAQTTVGSDWTGVIENPSFESAMNNGWTSNMGRQNNTSFEKTGTYYAEKWEPVGSYGVTQTISEMPAGVYRLSANAKARGVTSAKLYAAGIDQAITVGDNTNNYSVEFACDANANVTIGFEGVGTDPKTDASWLCVDNFTLTLVSAGLPDVVAVEGKMKATVAQTQTDAVAAYNAERTVANYNAASAAIAAAQTSKDAYTAANVAITKAEALQAANTFVTSAAATTFADAIAAIKTPYNEGTLSDADATAAGTTLGVAAVGWHAAATNTSASNYMGSTWPSTYTINDWSVEGDSDGSNYSVPFFQNWVADANSLDATTMTGTLEGLSTGTYKVTAWVRVRAKNGTAATAATGITMDVNGGDAVDVTEGTQVGTTQFQMATYEATGYVLDDGVLKVNFNIAENNNISWLSFKNISYERTGDVPAADADDYTALASAISAVSGYVAGFEAGEYAPYNNVEAFAALAAAQAIDPNATNLQSVVQAATTALTVATWTVNTEEVNAFYDGTFNIQNENTTPPTALVGWNNPEGIRQLIKNTETYPGLNSATDKAAVFAWGNTTLTYGNTVGYTMPLAAHTIYELTFKTCGWADGDMGYVNVTVLNDNNEGMTQKSSAIATKRIGEENPWNESKYLFTTGEAGNYIFGLWTSKHTVLTDLKLVKANIVIEANGTSSEAYDNTLEGAVDVVTLNRPISAGYNTLVLPFDVTADEVTDKFGADSKVYVVSAYSNDNISLATQEGINANQPVILKATEAGASYEFTNKTLEAATPTYEGTDVSMIGTYAASTDVPQNGSSYVISGDKLYLVDSNVIIRNTRAYISISTQTSSAKPRLNLIFDGDEATGIDGIAESDAEDNGKMYDLSGREVKNPTKGIYIKNGKKVYVK